MKPGAPTEKNIKKMELGVPPKRKNNEKMELGVPKEKNNKKIHHEVFPERLTIRR